MCNCHDSSRTHGWDSVAVKWEPRANRSIIILADQDHFKIVRGFKDCWDAEIYSRVHGSKQGCKFNYWPEAVPSNGLSLAAAGARCWIKSHANHAKITAQISPTDLTHEERQRRQVKRLSLHLYEKEKTSRGQGREVKADGWIKSQWCMGHV